MNKIKFYLIPVLVTLLFFGCEEQSEPQPDMPTITINSSNGAEGSSLIFDIVLSKSSEEPISVEANTLDITAEAGKDYEAVSHTITFNPGDTLESISVTLLTDTETEDSETFTVKLSNASNAKIGSSEATGTITDDEPNSTYFMEAKIDGALWNAQVGGFFGASVLEVGPTSTTIGGYGTDGDSQMVLTLPFGVSSIEETSYDINSFFGPQDVVFVSYSPTFFSSGGLGIVYWSTPSSGTLTITKYDEENGIVEGTFNYTAEAKDDDDNIIGTIEVTEGSFSLPVE